MTGEAIEGLANAFSSLVRRAGNASGSGPSGSLLGSDRRAAYYGGAALTGGGQSVGLFEIDSYNPSDLQAYFTNVGQTLSVPINNVPLLGASAGSDGDDHEQIIDIIEAVSMAPGLSQLIVYIIPNGTEGGAGGDTYLFNRMASDDIAKQLSVSFVWTPAYTNSNDGVFQEFAAQGQSLFVASGDWGSYPVPASACNDGESGCAYPPEDQYVTAVGGTELQQQARAVHGSRKLPGTAAEADRRQTAQKFPAINSSSESSTRQTMVQQR